MNRNVVDLGGLHERASATPEPSTRPAKERVLAHAIGSAARAHVDRLSEDATLRGRQRWFVHAVTNPESEPSATNGEGAARILTPGPRLGPLARLEIYRRGYHARLVECLADDYPVTRVAMGDDSFEQLCRLYIAEHPSSHPNLNAFGRHMEALCQRAEISSLFPSLAFIAGLAALEWAIVEVIHAPSSPSLSLEGLREIPMESWAGARLAPNTALRLLHFAFPVNTYFQAVREGRDSTVPGAAPSATVVYRSGPTVWRMDLTPPMHDVLSALVAGESLGIALSRAAPYMADIDEAEAGQRVMGWFREWIASGLFVGVSA